MRSMHPVNAPVRSPEVPTPPSESTRTRQRPAAQDLRTDLVVARQRRRARGACRAAVLDAVAHVAGRGADGQHRPAPLHLIPHLLRDDGAPPLYYVLLHFWMKVFGTSDLGARSLSGVIGVLTLPAAWVAGYRVGSQSWRARRWAATRSRGRSEGGTSPGAGHAGRAGRLVAWTTTLLVATSPFAVYYDTEARMYSLVILLSTLGRPGLHAVLRRADDLECAGSRGCDLWPGVQPLLGAVLCGRHRRRHGFFRPVRPLRARCRVALVALAVGTLRVSAPWVPTFLFQLRHTGTPWATPADFTALVYTFTQFAGGDSDAGRALALVLAFLALLAIAGSALDGRRVVLDLRHATGSPRACPVVGRDPAHGRDRGQADRRARSRTATPPSS